LKQVQAYQKQWHNENARRSVAEVADRDITVSAVIEDEVVTVSVERVDPHQKETCNKDLVNQQLSVNMQNDIDDLFIGFRNIFSEVPG
jgi:hypothetical protein